MYSSVEHTRHISTASNLRSVTEAPLMLAEPAEDAARPARGIIVACGISLIMWAAALSLLL
jgi:hypothetical protein